MSTGGSQPPRNRIEVIALIRIMLAYSPRKKSAKAIAEYSEKYPATSSDSASGRSKGARLVSASAEMKKITNIGRSGSQYQENRPQAPAWASTMSDRRSEEHTSELQSLMRNSYA